MTSAADSPPSSPSTDIFPWHASFDSGLPEVDAPHQALVERLNDLASSVACGVDARLVEERLHELAAHAVDHLGAEEAIWAAHLAGDPSEAEHRALHRAFVDALSRLDAARGARPLLEVALEALGYATRWLAAHFLDEDRLMAHMVLTVREGLPLEAARLRAGEAMGGASRALSDVIVSVYGTLAANTLQMMRALAEQRRHGEAQAGLLGAGRDPGRRHPSEAERELRLRESYLEAIVENQPGLVWLKDAQSTFLAVNHAFARSCGQQSPQSLVGKNDLDIWPADLAHKYRQDDAEIMETRTARMVEETVSDRGERRWFETFKTPVVDDAGRVIGTTGYSRDITARKQSEEALRRSQAFLDSVVENIPAMIFVKEARDLRFVRLNRAGEALLGRSHDELVGRTDADVFPRDEAEFFTRKDREVLEGGVLLDIPEETIETVRQGQRILHTRKIPLLDDDGRPEYLLGISEDITERRRAEQQVLELNAELERRVTLRTAELAASNKELEAFAYSVSHDLRAPLRAIDGFSRIIEEEHGDRLEAAVAGYLQEIRGASRRMAILIDALLEMSRITRAEIVRHELDLGAMARRALAELQRLEPSRRVTTSVADGLMANGDPLLLQVALGNLLANAWKFTSKNPHAQIEMGRLEEEGSPVFFVRDNGAGFNMRYGDKLFGAFQRLHGVDEFEGSGVGLATVQRVIHRHGGRVWAEGEVGHGATFYFTL